MVNFFSAYYKKIVYKLIFIICRSSPEFFSKNFKVLFSKYIYHVFTGKYLNLRVPKSINEKLMWLKLYYENELTVKCTDKFLVREYLGSKRLSNILNELYGVYDTVDEIDFDNLPQKFALKATHGCGYNIICSDKSTLKIADVKTKLNFWLNSIYGLRTGEWQYARIKPRIICEKYLEHPVNSTSVADFKIHCLNGQPFCILVYYNRSENSKMRTAYNLNWERINVLKNEGGDFEKPQNLDAMLQIAVSLSEPFPYVRVDLYEVEGRLYFGELTFTPHGGMMINFTDETLDLMGKQLILPKRNRKRIPI
ncbi:MAG: hypothetical protein FD181_1182 [Prolixibacteraceae bacterium]|nr:MAG: hypothetical protein FD181_1182 [Prolixibacteraceae bacterium]